MTIFNLSPFIRTVKRYNGIVYLNIAGLALGLASVLFISLWIKHELSYDRFYDDCDRIYRVESLMNFTGEPFVWTSSPAPVAESMLIDFPEVEAAVRLRSGFQDAIEVEGELFTTENLFYGESSYFNLFSRKLLMGDPEDILEDPRSVVISERIAHILFGQQDPVGKAILLNNSEMLYVSGVMVNQPSNTHLEIDYLISFSLLEETDKNLADWRSYNVYTYIMLAPNTDDEQFNIKIGSYLKTKNENSSGTLFINPLTRIYLYRDPGFDSMVYPSADRGPVTGVILFGVIGVLILSIACINFINLSTACATERSREIGVRKVNGAGRSDLVIQLFTESLVQTFIAMIIALIIVIIALPLFNRISGIETNISSLFIPGNLGLYLLLITITGLIAGFYPAAVLSSFKPVKVIKPQPEETLQGGGLRKILVVVQFILAITFIFCILVMNGQLNFLQSEYLGFNQERVMVIYPKTDPVKSDLLAQQISIIAGVSNVATGDNVPVRMGNWRTLERWDGNNDSKKLKFYSMQVDDDYINLLGFEIAEGRQFTKGATGYEIMVNEAALKGMEMDDPLGKGIWIGDKRYTIIGVVSDFNFHKLKDEVLPVYLYKNDKWWSKKIFVKLEPGNHLQVLEKIDRLIKESAPGYPSRYIFLDEEINRYYEEERRLSALVNSATFLTVIISCIGLFSLTAFTLRRRRREIGVRKAHGASVITLLLMLQKEFGTLLIISSVIALPSGYIIMRKWLQAYASHISIDPVYFILAIMVITALAALTIIFHTLRAAGLNPASALSYD